GLVAALQHFSDLLVLHANLRAQKFVFAFQPRDIPILCRDKSRQLRCCRRLSRLVAASCSGIPLLFSPATSVAACRGSPDRSHLVDVSDVPLNRRGRDQEFFTKRR